MPEATHRHQQPRPGPTTIAFYLPQYYPIPENDAWYGEGFTEWRNVASAAPLFPEHYQPHLPRELGFYDLRVRDVRVRQAVLAKSYGIDAFCYYHYWFDGHRPLARVVDDVLAHGSPDMPFCLAWANENWSRHWDASSHEVLLRQTYSTKDDAEHGRFLLRAMQHPLYLRVAGKPVLFVYRIQALPDAVRTLAAWRRMWRDAGLGDVQVVKFDTHDDDVDPASYGADAAAQFLPHGLSGRVPRISPPGAHPHNRIFDYDAVASFYSEIEPPEWRRYECVAPSWDNTPRRGDGASMLLHGSTPERYAAWLRTVHGRAAEDGLVLINAWNEWAEGAHLEPDLRHGLAYLRATAAALGVDVPRAAGDPARPSSQPARADSSPEPGSDAAHVEAFTVQTDLRRKLSRLEGTLERQIELATRDARAEEATARAHALALVREIDRLRERLAAVEAESAER